MGKMPFGKNFTDDQWEMWLSLTGAKRPDHDNKTLLDEFAMAALTGMLASGQVAGASIKDAAPYLAEQAYDWAEAMQGESVRRHEAIIEKCKEAKP